MSGKYNNYLTDEEKETILKLKEDGYSNLYIANKLNRSDSSIGRFLKKNGIVSKKGYSSKLSDEEIENVKELYKSGMTSKEIYKLYSNKIKCEETIQRIIRNSGLSRSRGNQNNINHEYFNVIDTPTKAYFVGLILTDGNIHYPSKQKRSPILQIDLHSIDRHIIETLRSELDAEHKKITDYSRRGTSGSRISFSSTRIINDLEMIGIVEHKTHLINKLPDIPSKFIPDLIRGIFDGDGSVYYHSKAKKLRIAFYGTYGLLDSISSHLNLELGFPKNKIVQKDGVCQIGYGNQKDIKAFYDYIYYSDNVVCLKRKHDKFKEYMK